MIFQTTCRLYIHGSSRPPARGAVVAPDSESLPPSPVERCPIYPLSHTTLILRKDPCVSNSELGSCTVVPAILKKGGRPPFLIIAGTTVQLSTSKSWRSYSNNFIKPNTRPSSHVTESPAIGRAGQPSEDGKFARCWPVGRSPFGKRKKTSILKPKLSSVPHMPAKTQAGQFGVLSSP